MKASSPRPLLLPPMLSLSSCLFSLWESGRGGQWPGEAGRWGQAGELEKAGSGVEGSAEGPFPW